MRKIRYILPLITGLWIFIYGFISVNCNLPTFIKDNSSIKTYCKTEPFDLLIEIKDCPYYIHINKEAFLNLKEDSINSIIKFVDNTSSQLSNGSKNAKEKTKHIGEEFLDNFFYRKVQ